MFIDLASETTGCHPISAVACVAAMPGFMPGIHVLTCVAARQDVDGRDKPGHDKGETSMRHTYDEDDLIT
jgi:hypothetical protein